MKTWQRQSGSKRYDEGQEKGFTISQVARLTGINAKTIRYYESSGVLPRPARFANSYRRYDLADVNRLLLLQRIRMLGVPLAQAAALLNEATDALCLDVQRELLGLVEARQIAIEQEIAELQRLREELLSYQHTLADCHPDENETFRNCANVSCFAVSEIYEQKGECCDDVHV